MDHGADIAALRVNKPVQLPLARGALSGGKAAVGNADLHNVLRTDAVIVHAGRRDKKTVLVDARRHVAPGRLNEAVFRELFPVGNDRFTQREIGYLPRLRRALFTPRRSERRAGILFPVDRVLHKAQRRRKRLRRSDTVREARRHTQLFEEDARGDELVFKPRRDDKAAIRDDARRIAAPRRRPHRHAHAEHLRGVVGLGAKRVRFPEKLPGIPSGSQNRHRGGNGGKQVRFDRLSAGAENGARGNPDERVSVPKPQRFQPGADGRKALLYR